MYDKKYSYEQNKRFCLLKRKHKTIANCVIDIWSE